MRSRFINLISELQGTDDYYSYDRRAESMKGPSRIIFNGLTAACRSCSALGTIGLWGRSFFYDGLRAIEDSVQIL